MPRLLPPPLVRPPLPRRQGLRPTPSFQAEKCYGIAKAGQNDCASTGNNSCAGTSRANADPNAWVYVPAGYCDRIVNANKAPKA